MDAHKNFAYTSVAVAPVPAASGLSLTLAAGGGALMPATPFNATVCATGAVPLASNAEIVRVTNVAGDVLTIVRAQENTVARAIVAGDQFFNAITAKTLTDVETAFAGTGLTTTTAPGTAVLGTHDSAGLKLGIPAFLTTAALVGAYLTTAALSQDSSKYAFTGFTSTTIAGAAVAGTHDTAGLKLAIPAFLTTAQSPGAYLTTAGLSQDSSKYAFTGFTATTAAGAVVAGTHDTAGLKLAVPAYLTTAALSNHSHGNPQLNLTNLSGTTASNSAGFTLSLSAGTVAPSPVNFSAGTTSGNLGSVVFSNANGVSFGINGSTITGSVDPTSSVVGTSGITVSSNGNSASFYITASNTNNVSFGFSNGALTGSIATTYAGTGFTSTTTAGVDIKATNNTSGLSMAVPAYLTTAALSNHSHGNPQLNLTNLSGTTASNSAGFTLSLSAAAPGGGAQTAISGIIASDATYTSGSVYFSGQNNITIGSSVNGASQYVRFSVGAYLTTAALSGDTTNYAGVGETVGTIAGSDLAMTVNTAGVSIGYPKWLTTAQAPGAYLTTARASTDAVGLNTALTANGVSWTVNSSGISLNVPAFLTTAALSNHSHGNPTLNLTNLSGTTGSNSAGFTLSLSAAAPGAAAESNAFNLLGANTAGNTTATGSTIGLSGINMTLSGANNSQIILSVPATSSLVGTNGISISTNGSTISIGNSDPMVSQYDPYQNAPVSNSTLGQSTIYFAPFDIPEQISASRINFFLSLANTFSGAPANSTAWLAIGYGIYTRGTGASTDRISLLTSYALTYLSGSASSSTQLRVTNYIGLSNATSHSTSQYAVSNASVSNYLASSIIGYRAIALPLNLTLLPGRSWLGVSMQSSAQGASLAFAHSMLQLQYSNNIAYRVFGQVSAASNASFYGASDGMGNYSAQTAAWPASIPLTSDSIRGAPVMTLPYFNFSGIGTSTNIL